MLTPQVICLLLNRFPKVTSIQLTRLRQAVDRLEQLAHTSAEQLQQMAGLAPVLAAAVAGTLRDTAWAEQEWERARCAGVTILTWVDAAYPVTLRTIPDPPLALYLQGALTDADALAVAFVGSRHASLYGLECAQRLAADAAQRGMTVVSGLARGIDAAAHRGALSVGGRTIAVLGSGFNHLYPPDHAPLAQQVSVSGAVVSEYPMDALPQPYHFPRRNRIISGLSLGVVVVEAAARSGALITADCALEQGREVFAVPGPMRSVTSQGTHGLLKQGARLVTSVEDLLEELHLTSQPVLATMSPQPHPGADSVSALHRRLLDCLSTTQPTALESVVERSGVSRADAVVGLLELEMQQQVRQRPGQQFVRCGKLPQQGVIG